VIRTKTLYLVATIHARFIQTGPSFSYLAATTPLFYAAWRFDDDFPLPSQRTFIAMRDNFLQKLLTS
jgi:hypothetical protein